MFRKELEEKLSKIFGFRKTTFEAPSDAFEQDTLFIEIDTARTRPSQGRIFSKVTGQLVVFSQDNKHTYGYLNKRIEQAPIEVKKNLFFYNVDTNVESSPARLINISERRTGFQYLYSADYDPNLGELTDLELEESPT